MKPEWFARKYLVFKGAYKSRGSRIIFFKAKKILGRDFLYNKRVFSFLFKIISIEVLVVSIRNHFWFLMPKL